VSSLVVLAVVWLVSSLVAATIEMPASLSVANVGITIEVTVKTLAIMAMIVSDARIFLFI
jgi:hypothetical protein